MNEAFFEDLVMKVFTAEDAINLYSMIMLLSHFKRLLTNYNFDSISVKF